MKKIKNNSGMSLGEMLVATLIMVLVSIGLATGVALSNKEFIYSIRQSEAQEIYSTLSNLLTNELRYTRQVEYKEGSSEEVKAFFSFTYNVESSLSEIVIIDKDDKVVTDDYGYLSLGNENTFNKVLGASSYPNNLGAKVTIKYNQTNKLFTVDLDIGVIGGSSIINKTFNVRSINNITIGS